MALALALALLALAAPRQTPSACAIAWNAGATAKQHALVVRSKSTAAFIDARVAVSTDTWTKSGGASSTGGPGCNVQFIVPGGGQISAWASWGSSAWHVLHSAKAFPVPHNARVHRDGTVGFTG